MRSAVTAVGMRRRALLSAARTALLTTPLAALAGCSGFGSGGTDSPTARSPTESPTASPTPTPAAVQTPDDAPLTVSKHAMERSNEDGDSEIVAVDAVIRNTSDTAVTDVRVVARFFDGDGASLDQSSARADRLAADGRWEVELLFPGSGDDARAVADYRILVERDD